MGSIDSSNLPYIQSNPKIIFFTDFDGTITLKDSESATNCFLPFAFSAIEMRLILISPLIGNDFLVRSRIAFAFALVREPL